MISERDVRSSSRHALGVRRYHAWPMLQEQDVAAHTAHMMRIWWCVWGPMPPEVSTVILWHDAGEGDAGDVQFGAKRRYPALKEVLDVCEAGHLTLLLGTDASWEISAWPGAGLDDRQRWRVKAVDLAEGYEHALVEVAMGNRLAVPVVDAYATALYQWCLREEADPDDDLAPLSRYQQRPYAQKLVRVAEAARRDWGG